MYLGWYDADKKKPAREKVMEAIERYTEKFGALPATCLTSVTDAADLATDTKSTTLAVAVRGVSFIPRWTFYVGIEDAPEPALDEAA